MKLLAIDTSAKAASVCLAEENKIIGESFINTSITHSQTLIPMVNQLLKNSGITIGEIEAIAVNAGPGSFTGVRIGVAAAKGLAFPNKIDCVSVSTLESMAYNLLGDECVVCAVMDARCNQVYNALFKISGCSVSRITEDRALSLEDLKLELTKYNEKLVVVGDGAEVSYNYFGADSENIQLAPINKQIQTASSTAIAAFKKIENGEILSPEKLMPVYLRLPQAQRELNKRLGVNK